jgi:hypothetical protein
MRQLGNELSHLVSGGPYRLPNPACCGIIVAEDGWTPAFAGETGKDARPTM